MQSAGLTVTPALSRIPGEGDGAVLRPSRAVITTLLTPNPGRTHRLPCRMDPAVSAAVFITTFTDVLGLLLFLGLATLLIDRLI